MSEEEVKATGDTVVKPEEQPEEGNVVAHLDKEDMALLQRQKLVAEKALSDARVAELEYRSLVQHIFLKYELKLTDKIDDATGVVTRD